MNHPRTCPGCGRRFDASNYSPQVLADPRSRLFCPVCTADGTALRQKLYTKDK